MKIEGKLPNTLFPGEKIDEHICNAIPKIGFSEQPFAECMFFFMQKSSGDLY